MDTIGPGSNCWRPIRRTWTPLARKTWLQARFLPTTIPKRKSIGFDHVNAKIVSIHNEDIVWYVPVSVCMVLPLVMGLRNKDRAVSRLLCCIYWTPVVEARWLRLWKPLRPITFLPAYAFLGNTIDWFYGKYRRLLMWIGPHSYQHTNWYYLHCRLALRHGQK